VKFLKGFVILLFILLAIIMIVSCSSGKEEPIAEPEEVEEELPEWLVAAHRADIVEEKPDEAKESEPQLLKEEAPKTIETSPKVTDIATLGEKNAARSALDYLNFMAFSYSGLVEQLKFEGYTHEEAVYGVNKCGANWNEQAALKAEDYLETMSFSREGLIAQLEFEGFTRQQAEYGVQAVGY
jgi:hypothetical protein